MSNTFLKEAVSRRGKAAKEERLVSFGGEYNVGGGVRAGFLGGSYRVEGGVRDGFLGSPLFVDGCSPVQCII